MAKIDPTVKLLYYLFLNKHVPQTDYEATDEKIDLLCRWVKHAPAVAVGKEELKKCAIKKLMKKLWIKRV